ncbi:hypothetical protein CONCODRAFT_72365 [Conidiobolus coronatus NRRL 28638]|uniref:Uncharacterized protein n=1 Tax=Conidiobolus coronatus (strain ATCC 28846 / CBS 209.66 / NRRL 28638) TaxID=796925 RepID=A0A137NZS2_CONC2|nr:hypothetical protein CONCODRAFT_72365 [Conidiobolus coronatus NRRL 28638]|eukprot:KXN68267.1 hypothetical protein CONCODRAFT_72365 [Conidiobolus coronatus NRRL 28638]
MKFSNIASAALLATSVFAGDSYYSRSLIEAILNLDIKVDINVELNIDIINHKCHPYIHNLDYYLCIEPLIGYPAVDPIKIKVRVDEVAEARAKVNLEGNHDLRAKAEVLELAEVKIE